jgi:hypothetical protein
MKISLTELFYYKNNYFLYNKIIVLGFHDKIFVLDCIFYYINTPMLTCHQLVGKIIM